MNGLPDRTEAEADQASSVRLWSYNSLPTVWATAAEADQASSVRQPGSILAQWLQWVMTCALSAAATVLLCGALPHGGFLADGQQR